MRIAVATDAGVSTPRLRLGQPHARAHLQPLQQSIDVASNLRLPPGSTKRVAPAPSARHWQSQPAYSRPGRCRQATQASSQGRGAGGH
jgi:hypothetical protein